MLFTRERDVIDTKENLPARYLKSGIAGNTKSRNSIPSGQIIPGEFMVNSTRVRLGDSWSTCPMKLQLMAVRYARR